MPRWLAAILLAVVAVLPLTGVIPPFWITLADNIGLSALVAMGLVLLTGVGGMTSFGQAALVGFGAYTTGVLTTGFGLSPWLSLPVSLVGPARITVLPLAASPSSALAAASAMSRMSTRFQPALPSGCG